MPRVCCPCLLLIVLLFLSRLLISRPIRSFLHNLAHLLGQEV